MEEIIFADKMPTILLFVSKNANQTSEDGIQFPDLIGNVICGECDVHLTLIFFFGTKMRAKALWAIVWRNLVRYKIGWDLYSHPRHDTFYRFQFRMGALVALSITTKTISTFDASFHSMGYRYCVIQIMLWSLFWRWLMESIYGPARHWFLIIIIIIMYNLIQ